MGPRASLGAVEERCETVTTSRNQVMIPKLPALCSHCTDYACLSDLDVLVMDLTLFAPNVRCAHRAVLCLLSVIDGSHLLAFLLQLTFKFWSPAHHIRHAILVPGVEEVM